MMVGPGISRGADKAGKGGGMIAHSSLSDNLPSISDNVTLLRQRRVHTPFVLLPTSPHQPAPLP